MTQEFSENLDAIIDERSLLKHPFYQAWTAGTLPLESLREYAKQYFHFEAAFPTLPQRDSRSHGARRARGRRCWRTCGTRSTALRTT